MKSLVWITAAAALVFGFNPNNANANNIKNVEVAETLNQGRVGSSYDEANETVTLRMATAQRTDRVLITISNSAGKVFYQEKALVSEKGSIVQISLSDLEEGVYELTVKGRQLSFQERFKQK